MTNNAAELAKTYVARFLATNDVKKQTPGQVLLWWHFGCHYISVGDKSVLTVPEENIGWVCRAALIDKDAREIARTMVASKLRVNYPISSDEAIFAGYLLSDLLPELEKTKRGKKLADNFERNVFIVMLARELRKLFEVDFLRNDEPRTPKTSAADLISEAFQAAGRHEVTFRAVKEVLSNSALREYIDVLEGVIEPTSGDDPSSLKALASNALAPAQAVPRITEK